MDFKLLKNLYRSKLKETWQPEQDAKGASLENPPRNNPAPNVAGSRTGQSA